MNNWFTAWMAEMKQIHYSFHFGYTSNLYVKPALTTPVQQTGKYYTGYTGYVLDNESIWLFHK